MSIFVELPPDLYDVTAFDAFAPTGTFSLGTARAAMWAAQLAYETQQPRTLDIVGARWNFSSLACFEQPSGLSYADTRGIIARRGDVAIVAFAGTDPAVLENLVTDLMIVRHPESGTHGGFTHALEPVWEQIAAALAAAPDAPVLFTGHSLGAALATLAAMRAAEVGRAPCAVYTFGSPRVGDAAFAKRYDERLGDITYRFAHGDDIVPTLPMSRLGFRHVGRYLHCAAGKKFNAAALSVLGSDKPGFRSGLRRGMTREVMKLWSHELFSPPGPGPIGSLFTLLPVQLRDHLPDRYIEALKP